MLIHAQSPAGEILAAACDADRNPKVTSDPSAPLTITLQPSTAVNSTAYEAAHVLKSSAGTLRSCFVQFSPALAGGTYYVQLIRDSAIPADGSVSFHRPPFAVVHTLGQPTQFVFDEGVAGMAFGTGCVICVSSTQFAKTEVLSAALFAGSVL